MSQQFNSGGRKTFHNRVFAVLFAAIGLAMGYHAYTSMNLGTLDDMGPGFFPLMLSVVLALLAIGVGFTELPANTPPITLARVKSIILIIGAPLLFAATIRTLGLVLSLSITVFAVSFASRYATLKQSLALSVGFTAFCVVLFSYILDLSIPLRGSLLSN